MSDSVQGPKVHELKTWPDPFQAVWDGAKRFELRKDDRGYAAGDELLLREYDNGNQEYLGRWVRARVTYLTRVLDWLDSGASETRVYADSDQVVLGITPFLRCDGVHAPEPCEGDTVSGEAYRALTAEHAKLLAEFDEEKRDKLAWEQRCRHAEEVIRDLEGLKAVVARTGSDLEELMGPYDPAREGEMVTVPYGAWFQQQRLRVSAEVARDENKAVTVQALDALQADIPDPLRREPAWRYKALPDLASRVLEAKLQLQQENDRLHGQVRSLSRRLQSLGGGGAVVLPIEDAKRVVEQRDNAG